MEPIVLSSDWKDLDEISRILSSSGHSISYTKLWHYCVNNHIEMRHEGRRISVRMSDLGKMRISVDLEFLVKLVNAARRGAYEIGVQEASNIPAIAAGMDETIHRMVVAEVDKRMAEEREKIDSTFARLTRGVLTAEEDQPDEKKRVDRP